MTFGKDDIEEKTMPETDKLSLVNALVYLHMLRDILAASEGDFNTLFGLYVEAFDRIFEYIDEVTLLLGKIGGESHE